MERKGWESVAYQRRFGPITATVRASRRRKPYDPEAAVAQAVDKMGAAIDTLDGAISKMEGKPTAEQIKDLLGQYLQGVMGARLDRLDEEVDEPCFKLVLEVADQRFWLHRLFATAEDAVAFAETHGPALAELVVDVNCGDEVIGCIGL